MNTTFDPAKDALNLAKHGISLAQAAQLDWDTPWCRQIERRKYGEHRHWLWHLWMADLWVVVFTGRPESRRVISLRKANLREYRRYEQAP
jgi:uncharacterized protein